MRLDTSTAPVAIRHNTKSRAGKAKRSLGVVGLDARLALVALCLFYLLGVITGGGVSSGWAILGTTVGVLMIILLPFASVLFLFWANGKIRRERYRGIRLDTRLALAALCVFYAGGVATAFFVDRGWSIVGINAAGFACILLLSLVGNRQERR